MMLYANDQDDTLPPDLKALIDGGAISRKSLISPLDEDIEFNENSDEPQSSYLFIAPGLKMSAADRPSEVIIVYEKPENYDGEGTNALFLDGHVEFIHSFMFDEKLERTMAFLREQGIGTESEDQPTSEPPAEEAQAKPPTEEELKDQIDLVQLLVAKGGPVATAIDLFRKDVGRYPKDLGELLSEPADEKSAEKWAGPYVKVEDDIKDLWGHPLQYAQPGKVNKTSYDLWSVGPDGEDGTADDIANFKRP